jgi:hypothetical protein
MYIRKKKGVYKDKTSTINWSNRCQRTSAKFVTVVENSPARVATALEKMEKRHVLLATALVSSTAKPVTVPG